MRAENFLLVLLLVLSILLLYMDSIEAKPAQPKQQNNVCCICKKPTEANICTECDEVFIKSSAEEGQIEPKPS